MRSTPKSLVPTPRTSPGVRRDGLACVPACDTRRVRARGDDMDELDLRPADREGIPASDVGLDLAPRLGPGVGAAFLDEEGVLLDPATGASHVLDQPAALVTRF